MQSQEKIQYREFCQEKAMVPLFHEPWWLDVVCGTEGWDVVGVRGKGGNYLLFMPIPQKNKWGFKLIQKPLLTPFLGPWIVAAPGQVKSIRPLIDLSNKIPNAWYFNQTFRPEITNWQPFYWANFRQTTRYTHRLSLGENRGVILNAFRSDVRQKIKKAQKQGIVVMEDQTIDTLYNLLETTFNYQNRNVPVTKALVSGLWLAIKDQNRGKILIAKDPQGRAHAGLLMVWDQSTCYQLMAGSNALLRSSGAFQLLVAEEVRSVPTHCQQLDFCGSMLQNIATINSSFGAVPTPYFHLFKGRNRLVEALAILSGKG